MGTDCLTVKQAWGVYDRWLSDPKIEIRREPAELDALFRRSTARFSQMSSPKALGDCYLLALSQVSDATLVTLDGGLSDLGGHIGQDVVLLS